MKLRCSRFHNSRHTVFSRTEDMRDKGSGNAVWRLEALQWPLLQTEDKAQSEILWGHVRVGLLWLPVLGCHQQPPSRLPRVFDVPRDEEQLFLAVRPLPSDGYPHNPVPPQACSTVCANEVVGRRRHASGWPIAYLSSLSATRPTR